MRDTLYTRTLVQAAEIEGSTQALAHILKVPESTLLRWLAGHAQMPLRAFVKAVDLLSEHEKRNPAPHAAEKPAASELEFRMGEHFARCQRCDGTQFRQKQPGTRLRMTSELLCAGCGEEVIHGNLIVRLATDAIQHSRAMTVSRARAQLKRRKARAAAGRTDATIEDA